MVSVMIMFIILAIAILVVMLMLTTQPHAYSHHGNDTISRNRTNDERATDTAHFDGNARNNSHADITHATHTC